MIERMLMTNETTGSGKDMSDPCRRVMVFHRESDLTEVLRFDQFLHDQAMAALEREKKAKP